MPVDFSHPNAQPFLLEAGDCALLLIHGFTGSPGHMRPVGEAVHAAGFTVRGIALPGHCQSIEAMEQSDWKQWLACCRDAMRQMQAKYRRVSVGGLSMGGILSLLMAEEFSPASVVLFAPALKYKRAANKLSPWPSILSASWTGASPTGGWTFSTSTTMATAARRCARWRT